MFLTMETRSYYLRVVSVVHPLVPNKTLSVRKGDWRRGGTEKGRRTFHTFLYPIFLIITLSYAIATSYEKYLVSTKTF